LLFYSLFYEGELTSTVHNGSCQLNWQHYQEKRAQRNSALQRIAGLFMWAALLWWPSGCRLSFYILCRLLLWGDHYCCWTLVKFTPCH